MQIFFKGVYGPLLRRWAVAVPLLGVGMTALLLGLLITQGTGIVSAVARNQVSVIIQFGDQARVVRSIEFDEPISGITALELASVEVVTTSTNFGDAVCSIGGVGCPATNCFCSSSYWGYSYWDGADWRSYPVSAGTSVISRTGAVEGWRWGEFGATLAPITPALQSLTAINWLAARQTITGDFGGVGATVETVMALGANRQHDSRAIDYLAAAGSTYARSSAAAAGKLAVAMSSAGGCLPAGALTPAAYFSRTLGAYSTQSGVNAWAMLGSAALSETIPASATAYLTAQIQPDGGWEWAPGWGVDTNATALALQALVVAGESISSSAVISGLTYLDSVQNGDGGFPYAAGAGAVSDVNSTAYVIQGLIAAGEDPRNERWRAAGGNPFDYLATMQLPDGSFEWQAGMGSNQLATQQVIPALLEQPHPVQRLTLPACPGVHLPLVRRD